MRADFRVRLEWRNGVRFGGGTPINGACNSLNAAGSGTSAHAGIKASDFYIQQWARLGVGYDPSPHLNFSCGTTGLGDVGSKRPPRRRHPGRRRAQPSMRGATARTVPTGHTRRLCADPQSGRHRRPQCQNWSSVCRVRKSTSVRAFRLGEQRLLT